MESAPLESAYLDFFRLGGVVDCLRGRTTRKLILVVEDKIELESLEPDFGAMLARGASCASGIAVTKASRRYDFESRYFNPWAGVNEDPVTGSVHTALAGYWAGRLGKRELAAYQASMRPGLIRLSVEGESVEMLGRARVVLAGTLRL